MVNRKPYVGKMMYSIFWDGIRKEYYVQPCRIKSIEKGIMECECHNSGMPDSRCGTEWFTIGDIGHILFFTYDSARAVMLRGKFM